MPTDKPFHAVEGLEDDEKSTVRPTQGGPEQAIVSDPLLFIQGCALEAHWIGFNASLLKKYVTQKGLLHLRFKKTSDAPILDMSDKSNFDVGWVIATGDHSSILLYKPDVYKLLFDNGHRLKAEYKDEWKNEKEDYERQRNISAGQEASQGSAREDGIQDNALNDAFVDRAPSNEDGKPRVVVNLSLFEGKSGPAARNALRSAGFDDCVIAYVMSQDMRHNKTDIGKWLKNDLEGNHAGTTYRRHVDNLLLKTSDLDIVLE